MRRRGLLLSAVTHWSNGLCPSTLANLLGTNAPLLDVVLGTVFQDLEPKLRCYTPSVLILALPSAKDGRFVFEGSQNANMMQILGKLLEYTEWAEREKKPRLEFLCFLSSSCVGDGVTVLRDGITGLNIIATRAMPTVKQVEVLFTIVYRNCIARPGEDSTPERVFDDIQTELTRTDQPNPFELY